MNTFKDRGMNTSKDKEEFRPYKDREEFQPSDDFVAKVMRSIYDHEEKQQTEKSPISFRINFSKIFQYALPAGGILFGLCNLARFYFAVLAPAICW